MSDAERHLVLVHSEGWQDINDFHALKRSVEALAPDIKVFIASNDIASSTTRKQASRRPTLVFSPLRLGAFKPDRGKVYAGRPMSKLDEMRRLEAAGIPVPEFEELTADTVLDRDRYGPLTILKPSYAFATFGSGIELWRTSAVRYRPPDEYPAWHPGRVAPMIAQRYIDCGLPMTCRVLTFFGEPVFTYLRQSTVKLRLPDAADVFEQRDYMPSPPDMSVSLSTDPDFLAFASLAHAAMPDVALQACDILKEEATGRLYLLEINPGGGTWMFSNDNAPGYRRVLGISDLMAPFGALERMARALVRRTRIEAE